MTTSANLSISTECILAEEARRYKEDIFYAILFDPQTLSEYYAKMYKCVERRIENNSLSRRLQICFDRLKSENNKVIQHAFIFFALSNVKEARELLLCHDNVTNEWLDSIFEANTIKLLEGRLVGIVDYVYEIRNMLIMR